MEVSDQDTVTVWPREKAIQPLLNSSTHPHNMNTLSLQQNAYHAKNRQIHFILVKKYTPIHQKIPVGMEYIYIFSLMPRPSQLSSLHAYLVQVEKIMEHWDKICSINL